MNNIKKDLKIGSSIAASVLLFIFGETVMIAMIYIIGPLATFIILNVIFGSLALLAFKYYRQFDKENKEYNIFKSFIKKKTQNIPKWVLNIGKKSKYLAIIVSSIILGPIITSLVIGVINFSVRKSQFMIVISSLLCIGFWEIVYLGGYDLVKRFA